MQLNFVPPRTATLRHLSPVPAPQAHPSPPSAEIETSAPIRRQTRQPAMPLPTTWRAAALRLVT
jgi:hypothetical protein